MPNFKFKNIAGVPREKFIKTPSMKIEEKRFTFCFEFSSMKGGYICFDNPHFEPRDIIRLIECLKRISQHTIGEIFERKADFHFHEVDLSHHLHLSEIYRRVFNAKINEQLPCLYQFEIFTDNKRFVAPRLTFYIQEDGVAKVVFLDYHHLLCSHIYGKPDMIPDNWFEHYILN